MSVRNPTTFNVWVDQMKMQTAKEILATEPAKVVDDQHFVLDREEMVLGVVFPVWESSDTGWVTIGIWHLESKDMCGDASVVANEIAHDFYVSAFLSGAGTAEIRLVSTLTSDLATATIDATDSVWVSAGDMVVATNALEDTLTLAARVTGGAISVRVRGFALFANET
jgi:hypothetical protein